VIKKADIEEGVSFTAKVDILPKATLGDIKSIKVERKKVEVNDKDVERELNVLAKMRSDYIDVARPAQKGDSVSIDFKVSVDGKVIEGGESKNHPVHIGEGHFVPGFEDKLVGISAGDEREFEIEFPKDYGKKEWGGKKASVWVKAHAVQKQVVPKLDDEFAKKLGKFEGIDNLKYVLKSNLIQEKEKKEGERLRGEMMEKMVGGSSFTRIPEALINREIDHRLSDLEQMLAVHKQTVDDYLQKRGKKMSEIRESMRPEAEKSVKIGVCLQQFVKDQAITVEDNEVEKSANEYLAQYASSEQAKKEVDPERLKERVRNILLNQKALKELEEMVGVRKEEKADAPKEDSVDKKNEAGKK
jgi:trigger factor